MEQCVVPKQNGLTWQLITLDQREGDVKMQERGSSYMH